MILSGTGEAGLLVLVFCQRYQYFSLIFVALGYVGLLGDYGRIVVND